MPRHRRCLLVCHAVTCHHFLLVGHFVAPFLTTYHVKMQKVACATLSTVRCRARAMPSRTYFHHVHDFRRPQQISTAQRRLLLRRAPVMAVASASSTTTSVQMKAAVVLSTLFLSSALALQPCCMQADAADDAVYASRTPAAALRDADDMLQRAGVEDKDSLGKLYPYPTKGKIEVKNKASKTKVPGDAAPPQ